jgi:hypothetical protein
MASPAAATHLVEIADPPVPRRTSPVREMSTEEKLKITALLVAVGAGLCVGSWWLFHHDATFWGIVAGAFGLLFCVAGLGSKNLKAACPYCGGKIDTIARKDRGEGTHVHCERCYEYSTVHAGILSPLDPAKVSETPKFESPVFQNSVWPKGCVACGEAPVRFDDLSKTTVGAVPALMGRLQVMRGSVSGIPYCDKHKDKISLKMSSTDKKLIMCWTSLRMMRKYLAANRNRPVY